MTKQSIQDFFLQKQETRLHHQELCLPGFFEVNGKLNDCSKYRRVEYADCIFGNEEPTQACSAKNLKTFPAKNDEQGN